MPIFIPILVAGGFAATTAVTAYWQKQRTLQEVEKTKRVQEESAQSRYAVDVAKNSGSEIVVAGLTPGKLDDVAVMMKQFLPYILIAVGLVLLIVYVKKK